MVPTYQPQFQRLYAEVNAQSAQLLEEVLHPSSQRALLITRGKLSGLQTQADVLRYHLNRNLCRKEDVQYLITSWDAMMQRLQKEAHTKSEETAFYLLAAASVLLDGVFFLERALLDRGEFEDQLDDDGELEDRRKYG